MNGSFLAALTLLIAALARLSARLFYDIEGEADPLTLSFIVGYFTISFPMIQVSSGRRDYVRLSNSVIVAAEALEAQVNEQQMKRMLTLTRLCRKLIALYFTVICCDIVMDEVLWFYSTLDQMSMLPLYLIYYRRICYVELICMPMGVFAILSLIVFHLEVGLCLIHMYKVLGELIENISTREGVYELVRIHQLLLAASYIYERVFSSAWSSIICNFVALAIVFTYTVIALSWQYALVFVAMSIFGILCVACSLGELIVASSSNVGLSVYRSDWVHATSKLRRDLSFVMLRSQRPARITAGLFGIMNLAKLSRIFRSWYNFVQALLNLL